MCKRISVSEQVVQNFQVCGHLWIKKVIFCKSPGHAEFENVLDFNSTFNIGQDNWESVLSREKSYHQISSGNLLMKKWKNKKLLIFFEEKDCIMFKICCCTNNKYNMLSDTVFGGEKQYLFLFFHFLIYKFSLQIW